MLRGSNISLALALCLFSVLASVSNSQTARPSVHGLVYEKSRGEVTPAMIAFFDQLKVEKPEARNFSDPFWRGSAAAKVAPADSVQNGERKMNTLLIVGIVFAVLGVGLVATALVAYVIHARSKKPWSFVGLAHCRGDPEVQLGTA